MLTLPDFKEKQILFILPEKGGENKLQFSNDNLCFSVGGKVVNKISCYKLLAVFTIGDLSLTSVLIQNCQKYGISLFLLKNNFETYAEIGAFAAGNYLLRMKQYSLPHEFEIAKHIVKNKILNQHFLLFKNNQITKYKTHYKKAARKIDSCSSEKELLGLEGNFTKNFFQQYFTELNWYKRLPRAKVDPINLLMDIGYTFLFNFVDSILRLYGFDVYKGFYHKLFFQRKSLACDLMEPFRCLIDQQILKSYHLKQIDEKDFKQKNSQVFLPYKKQKKYLKIFVEALMKNKEEIFCYLREFYYCILNDNPDYPVFKLK